MKAISEAGVRIRVAKVSGTSLKRRLQKSDPFKKKRCQGEGCLVCIEGDGGKCRVNGVTYEITCKRCKDVYVGQTSRNPYTRGLQHTTSITAPHHPQPTQDCGKPTSMPKPTLRHHVDTEHADDNTPPTFKMEVTGIYGGDATMRQVSEAVKIKHTHGQMNRQEEWRQIRLPRLALS